MYHNVGANGANPQYDYYSQTCQISQSNTTQNQINCPSGQYKQQNYESIELCPLKSYVNIFEHGIYQNSKSFVRTSLNLIPVPKKKFEKIRIPFGVVYTPYLSGVPICNASYHRMIRCRSCSAYINPYIRVIDDRSYYCSICFGKNIIDQAQSNYGFDLQKRPELRYAEVEYDSDIGFKDVPQALSLIFLLDTTKITNSTSYVQSITECMLNNLQNIPGDKRSSVAFVTFDKFIHTYHVEQTAEGFEIEHNIITDLEDPFAASHDSDFIRFKSDDRITFLLQGLPGIINSTASKSTESCFGSALLYCSMLLQKVGGGRITAFLSSPPNVGLHTYEARDDPTFSKANQDDSSYLQSIIDDYRLFGVDALEKNITIDIFCINSESVDLANLVPMCQVTGGEIFIAPNMEKSYFKTKIWLMNNFDNYLRRELRLSNSVKIRMNESFENYAFLGNFMATSFSKINIPVMNQYSTLCIQLHMVSNPPREFAYSCFQMSILSTGFDGIFRLRVATICVQHSDYFQNIFNSIDFPCLFGMISRMAAESALKTSLNDTKSAIHNALIDLINSYNSQNSDTKSFSMSVPIPVYQTAVLLYSLYKDEMFSFNNLRIDKRLQKIFSLKSWPLNFLISCSFTDPYFLDNYACFSLPSTCGSLVNDKIYILDSGFDVYIFFTARVPNDMVQKLIGVDSLQDMSDIMITLSNVNSTVNEYVHRFIHHITQNRPYKPNVIIMKDSCEEIRETFCKLLIFDNTDSQGSICEYFKLIRSKLLDVS